MPTVNQLRTKSSCQLISLGTREPIWPNRVKTLSTKTVSNMEPILTSPPNTSAWIGPFRMLVTPLSSIKLKWRKNGRWRRPVCHFTRLTTHSRILNRHMRRELNYIQDQAHHKFILQCRVTALVAMLVLEASAARNTSEIKLTPSLKKLLWPRK